MSESAHAYNVTHAHKVPAHFHGRDPGTYGTPDVDLAFVSGSVKAYKSYLIIGKVSGSSDMVWRGTMS
ncbi:hypothetical protein NDU88_002109 [Pleurodeles waltl]|uniref:Uncharacterized protein n=1 Tax=Pleurodeles waltl TaxID=8319 RepID=A0AAV7M309_PLEWA|nr:hypothetical protein NDU88_002109 [Pleurodeles waltl]